MKISLSNRSVVPATRLSRMALATVMMTPWLLWLDLNAMALRFVQLRGHWPMCETALPCRPTAWRGYDITDTIRHDPVYLFLDPAVWQEQLVLLSPVAGLILWFTVGKHLPIATRHLFLAAFSLGWICLVFDPTSAVSWYMD